MTRPLTGVRVVELAGIGPGPHAGMILADLGAEVIRVDRPAHARGLTLGAPEHDLLNRGKRSVIIDVKVESGRDAALDLVRTADILIEGLRPGVAERLGLGPEACHQVRPGLVYGRVTGWGQTGPRAQTAGHDINYLALTGALSAIGPADAPVPPLNLVADFGGGSVFLVVGVLAGLVSARATGQGTVVDAAMVDGVSSLLAMVHGALSAGWWTDGRQSNLLDGAAPFYTTYRSADERHMAVGALEAEFFSALLEGLDLAPTDVPGQHEVARWPEMRRMFAERFASRTQEEWDAVFRDTDACVTPVRTLIEAFDDDHLDARGSLTTVGGIPQGRPAPRFDAGTVDPGVVEPPGTSTRTVFADLGWPPDRITAALDSGALEEAG